MRRAFTDFLACPFCRSFPLELRSFERLGKERVKSGYLYCETCERIYFIIDAIPRLITEELGELIDIDWANAHKAEFDEHRLALERTNRELKAGRRSGGAARWNVEDVDFWESQIYSSPAEHNAYLARIHRSRPDAGNRTLPREKYIFSHIRPAIPGGTMVDIGCGYAQTIRILCNPSSVGYTYVGTDLAISALRRNSTELNGEWVQCSADALPFRPNSVDAVISLGTLHHVHSPANALRALLEIVKVGGYLGIHETTLRGVRDSRPGSRESAHNEAIDADEALAILSGEGEIIELKREFSPFRGVVASRFGEQMRTGPRFTRAVLWADEVLLKTIGRVVPYFGSRAILILMRKRLRRDASALESDLGAGA